MGDMSTDWLVYRCEVCRQTSYVNTRADAVGEPAFCAVLRGLAVNP